LDAKYKALKGMPDRQDLNQIATYAASYNCSRGALLYAQRAAGQTHVTKLGDMNGFELFASRFDLSAINIQNEEAEFAEAIVTVLHEGH
jgi:5-methylcytosine-specific restriction enzyme subunit McrC